MTPLSDGLNDNACFLFADEWFRSLAVIVLEKKATGVPFCIRKAATVMSKTFVSITKSSLRSTVDITDRGNSYFNDLYDGPLLPDRGNARLLTKG